MKIRKQACKQHSNSNERRHLLISYILSSLLFSFTFLLNAQLPDKLVPWWPQKYIVTLDKEKNVLSLSTPYYLIEHNLTAGGNISKVKYTYGRDENLLIEPVGVKVYESGVSEEYSDIGDNPAEISYENSGNSVRVVTDCDLHTKSSKSATCNLKTTYEYHWGYIKIRRELKFPGSIRVNKISILNIRLSSDLSDYGYRPGITEQANTLPFAFNVIKWRKQRSGIHFDNPLYTSSVPEYMVFLNKGIEGIEWFTSDNAWQWDYQMTGRPGTGLCSVTGSYKPLGIDVAVCPMYLPEGSVALKGTYVFDYYIGLSVLPGKANRDWLHAIANRNGGKWITSDQIKDWRQSGVSTISYQDDGDTDHDGIFWRDGIYPPYSPSEMQKLDELIDISHHEGIKIATYFSIKEFHPSAQIYRDSGEIWARRYNDKNDLKSTYSGAGDIYGVEMCLKSGWKDYLKSYIDQTLSEHKFDGVYYDWNIPLYCNNPFHIGKMEINSPDKNGIGVMNITPEGHRDIDELIEVMEWTRQRVGPGGLVIIHNTMAPMFVTENFANYVVSMEWGYGKLLNDVPPLTELPPEWNFAGARSRGVIGYGTIHPDAPPDLKKKLALEALLTGVTPWPVMPEAVRMHQVLFPLGDLNHYKFADWRNKSVILDDTLCASAIYSKTDTVFLIVGNLRDKPSAVTVRLNTSALPFPIENVTSVTFLNNSGASELSKQILSAKGENFTIEPAGEVLVRITGKK